MPDPRRVGVFIPYSNVFDQRVLEGISTFCQTRANWRLALAQGISGELLEKLSGDLHGVISGIGSPDIAPAMQAWKKPCVLISRVLPDCQFPRVQCDHHAIGRAGAKHLLDLGFKRFALCGFNHSQTSAACRRGFEEAIRETGSECFFHQVDPGTPDWPLVWKRVADWVTELPKPIGLMAVKDTLALEVLDACGDRGIRVPEQIGVLGMGNDASICERARPRLSSVDPGFNRIGFQAACLLDRMMSGKPVEPQTIFLPPVGVVKRASTDALAPDDPHVAAVLRYIHDHACDPMQVNDLLSIVPLSRRTMELRFLHAAGRSPHDEIRRVQLQRVTELLTQTQLPLDQVARASGFASAAVMIKVFHKEMGVTPGEHRRRFGALAKAEAV